ncbi:DUF6343 family protein [Streptomyces fragilis]|uniref:DUF6343 family protein n=1 Tax=Streptomyces fragilis TaxID=67301 RepID=A0ABV2YLL8_9ACTN|nr:DUF6343 family protein [Streptomyces fragilis]
MSGDGPGRQDPARGDRRAADRRSRRSGTEPVTARSALGLRLLLSAVFLPVFVALTVLFALWAADAGPGESPDRGMLVAFTVVCALVALLAAVDLLVVLRRRGRARHGA